MPLKAHNWVCNWMAFFGVIGLVFFGVEKSKIAGLEIK